MDDVERAVNLFDEGFSCSQAIFSAYAAGRGLDEETALRISSGFGGGMGRMGATCGAVTGAFMVIGLLHGRVRADDEESKERTYGLVHEFTRRFEARNQSTVCSKLLGFDIGTPEGLKAIRENNLFKTRCTKFVRDAAEILEDLLRTHERPR